MKAVEYTGHGGTEVIRYGDVPRPEPGPGEVLVDVRAGSLNHLDLWTRRGLPGLDLDLPHVPGSDAAGEVVAVGEETGRFEPGDRVAIDASVSCGECEFCRDGEETMCVEYRILGEHLPGVHAKTVAVSEDNLVPVPDGVDWEVAAAAPLVFGTAWRMLVTRGEIRPGETVLVLGASGGVGHAAVQIAAHAGAEVIAAAGSEEKRTIVRQLGADRAVDSRDGFAEEIRASTGKRGVDVVVDHVGEATWDDSLRSLAKGGRLLTCGATTGPVGETDIRRVFGNQLAVIGSTMATPGELDDVLSLVWDGTLEPRIRATLPMSETARGHELLAEREGVGKVVLVPDGERA